jgi:hypothetical protein
MEIVTGTWCFYCPGATMGAEDLLSHGDSVAVIEYHDADSFANTASDDRINYYQVNLLPTAIFDGTLSNAGGSHGTSMYTTYLPLYRQQMEKRTPFELFIYGTHTGHDYSVDINIHKFGQFINPNTVLHMALTESHIYYPWENQDTLQFVLRLMAPDDHGTPIDLTSQEYQTVHLDFSLDPSWVPENMEISAFIQDSVTREIYSGNKAELADLVLNGTGIPASMISDRIGENYPNPFNTSTMIPVFIEQQGTTEMTIWSMTGQKITNLYTGILDTGRHDISWNGTDDQGNRLPDGIYCFHMIKGGRSFTRKIILVSQSN